MASMYFKALALFYLTFGLITAVYPRLMQIFMTQEGIAASTEFSDQVWFHGGLDILSIALLLFVLSAIPATTLTLRAAASVALFPVVAIIYTLVTTPFWNLLFLVPAVAGLAFAAFGFRLANQAVTPAAAMPS